MQALPSHVDTRCEAYRANREGFLEQISYLNEQLALARAGGGEKYVERHAQRGKPMARERIELRLDCDSPFLEIAALRRQGRQHQRRCPDAQRRSVSPARRRRAVDAVGCKTRERQAGHRSARAEGNS